MSVLSHRISLGSGNGVKGSKRMVVAAIAVVAIAVVAVLGARISENRREAEFNASYKDGTSALQRGNIDDALLRLNKAVKLNPNDEKAHLNLGLGYSSAGKIKDAEREYLESLKLNPNQPETHYRLGVIYKSGKDYDKALLHFQKAKELDKNLYPADIMIAYVYREMGEPGKAVSLISRLIKAKPFGANLAQLHVELGLAYKAQGKGNLATLQWLEALKVDKNNVQAKKLLAGK